MTATTPHITVLPEDGRRTGALRALLLCLAASVPVVANAPPLVEAGRDTTCAMKITSSFFLRGSVTDDSAALPEPQITWTRIDGPDTVTIGSPSTAFSSVKFHSAGTYRFRLCAYDGEFTVCDSVRVTVEQTVPLRVTRPAPGEVVTAGRPYQVEWEMRPLEGMVVYLSTDQGVNWTLLTDQAVGQTETKWSWSVPEDVSCDSCQIKVASYALRDLMAATSGYFPVAPTRVRQAIPAHETRAGEASPSAFVTVNGRTVEAAHDAVTVERVSRPAGVYLQIRSDRDPDLRTAPR